ncbi:lipopolysaccharide biosynthesis protein [Clostridium sp.]|uniref:lipopolysaccharide biosynthesis protein n=1 Tax=Clostridium sp. TaxID=1506 RepID=UPI002612B282|nr:lipopolysaccharide biosynthesis protein [Clostridium sp.]
MKEYSNLKNGIIITFIAKYSNVFAQLLINSVLARLLLPSDFGIIAVISVFISFFNMLGDMGIGPAIIQNKALDEKEVCDIFKFSVIAAFVIAIGFYFFSYFIAFFYNDRIYVRLGELLSISVFFSICTIVPNAILYKEQKFKEVGLINIIVNVVVGIFTITLAFKGFSYYSLVFDSILKSIFIFLLCFRACKIRIEKGYSNNSIEKIKNYSSFQFLFNFINYFTRNLDNILVGKYLGASTLGYYDKSYKLMLYPVQNLTNVITPVLHPVLSNYQNEKDLIYNTYIKVIKVLAYLGIFVSVYCFFTAYEIIRIVYGPKWDESIPIFRILSISIVIQMVLSSIGSIFQATGYVNKLFSTGVVSAFFTVIAIVTGIISKSLIVLSIGLVIAFILNFFQCFYVLLTHVFQRSFIVFLMDLKNALIIGILMIVGYILTSKVGINNVLISAVFKLILGIITYAIGLYITQEYKLLKKVILRK